MPPALGIAKPGLPVLDISVDVSAGLQAVLIFEFYLRGNFPALMTKDNRHKNSPRSMGEKQLQAS